MLSVTSFAERSRAQLRNDALDALADAIVTDPGHPVAMASLAARVGISRQTLYNEFGQRDGMVAALADRENAALLGMVTRTLAEHPHDLPAAIAAAVDATLRRAESDPLHKALLTGDTALLPYFSIRAEPLLERSRVTLVNFVQTHYPDLPPTDAADIVDVVVRVSHSHLLLPREPSEVVAARIYTLVSRYLAADSPVSVPTQVSPAAR